MKTVVQSQRECGMWTGVSARSDSGGLIALTQEDTSSDVKSFQ